MSWCPLPSDDQAPIRKLPPSPSRTRSRAASRPTPCEAVRQRTPPPHLRDRDRAPTAATRATPRRSARRAPIRDPHPDASNAARATKARAVTRPCSRSESRLREVAWRACSSVRCPFTVSRLLCAVNCEPTNRRQYCTLPSDDQAPIRTLLPSSNSRIFQQTYVRSPCSPSRDGLKQPHYRGNVAHAVSAIEGDCPRPDIRSFGGPAQIGYRARIGLGMGRGGWQACRASSRSVLF